MLDLEARVIFYKIEIWTAIQSNGPPWMIRSSERQFKYCYKTMEEESEIKLIRTDTTL